jgi:hypothetical protein
MTASHYNAPYVTHTLYMNAGAQMVRAEALIEEVEDESASSMPDMDSSQ